MNTRDFRKYAHEFVDWMADYLDGLENAPVVPNVQPGDILRQLPESAPEEGESMARIFKDFKEIILPGMTHWQSPNFFGYFPANNSKPSILAEMLTSAMGAQCMVWLTSPAAEELETRTMDWLRQMIGLPPSFQGMIQDTASTATLCALLTARERASGFAINERGFQLADNFTVYCSDQAHSSIDKAVRIAGIGHDNLRKIETGDNFALDPAALAEAVNRDLRSGKKPLCVISTFGTTSSTAVDPIAEISSVCRRHGIWLHVDAAFAGIALILPEMRRLAEGIENVDSMVVNPHKWMFTNFDCSAFFIKDSESLVKTFSIAPEYLKTDEDNRVKNYRDWGIQLGRRFRALKLWFVLRSYGVSGIQKKLRLHVRLARWFAARIEEHPHFELMAPVVFNAICFRLSSPETDPAINELNKTLLRKINASRKIFLTHTALNGKYTLRLVAGQTEVSQKHVEQAWRLIADAAEEILQAG